MVGTCVACTWPGQKVERVVKARMDILVCVDAKTCMTRWPRPN